MPSMDIELARTFLEIVTTGSFTITGSESLSGQPLIVVAGGNITAAAASSINTSNGSGNGGNVVLVAGANGSDNGTEVTITGRSATGGSRQSESLRAYGRSSGSPS